jgi:hypothetical protein
VLLVLGGTSGLAIFGGAFDGPPLVLGLGLQELTAEVLLSLKGVAVASLVEAGNPVVEGDLFGLVGQIRTLLAFHRTLLFDCAWVDRRA